MRLEDVDAYATSLPGCRRKVQADLDGDAAAIRQAIHLAWEAQRSPRDGATAP